MAFDLCVIPASVVPYLSALQTRKFSITEITAHLVSEKLTREQCRLMTPDTFASSYGSSSHALHVRSSVSSEINLAITSSVSGNAPSGYTIVIQGYLNDRNSQIVLGVCVSDEPIVADASLRMFVNIEETNNVFRLRADFDGMVTQGLLDDILEQSLAAYPTIASYNSSTNKITFKNASNTELPNMEIDASAFIKDGMVKDVVIQNGNLVVSFNTDAGKEDISIPLSSIFNPSNYYTSTQTDIQISNAINALGSGSSKFVVADGKTLYPSQISNLTDHRPPGTSSDNPHYNSKNVSFKFDVPELPSNGTTFEVFFQSTSFVGSVQLVCGSSNYIYPIYFRGNDNVHCPTVPKGSVLRITFYENAFYGDFYDLADFGDEHEAYVYVGKVPVDKSGSDLLAFSGLVGIDRDTGKFSQLFTVNVTPNGAGVTSPRLKENSPIYACFQGDCFAAHPKVPFGNILRIHDTFYGQGTLHTNMLPFTYYPFDNGDTVDAHVVTNTVSQVAYKYFQVDNCPVYIQVESNRVLIGNPPADIPARLIGFMCSGAKNAGMIRLVESSDVSYMSDNEYSKTFAGVWDDNSVDTNTYSLSNVSTSLSYMSDNVLVGLSNSSSKLVPLLVNDACNGAVTINPNLDWDSPVYVLFAGYRCFSAHPRVDFRQVLKYDNDNNSFMFTFSPMGSETPSVADGADGNKYFGSANYPVFISDFCGSNSGYKSFCVGIPSDVNIPSSDLHWRLLGYTTSTPGYIRLTESHPFLKDFIYQTGGYVKLSKFTETFYDSSIGRNVTPSQYVEHIQKTKPEYNLTKAVQELVSNYGEKVFHIKDLNASSVSAEELNGEVYVGLPSMTTVEFKNRVSFRTSADEVAYIDRDGVYHGYAKGISSDPSLSFSPATSGTAGGTLSVSVGDKTSSSVVISPVRCARQPYVSSHNSNGSYPLVFTSDVDAGYKDLYTDTVNSLSYNPNSYTLTCPTFVGDLTGNADTATKATADASGNTITSYYCTLSTAQTVSGSKTFSGTSKFTGDVYITGWSSGGLRFADSDSLQTTDYVRVHGNCGSSYSGIDFQFYVGSDTRHSLSLNETKITSGSSTSYELFITPSASNICTLGASENKMKAIYATTYYGLAEQLFGTGVGSLYLLKFKAVNTSKDNSFAIYSRGNLLNSISSCKISNICNVTVFNGSGSTISTTDSSGYCLYMYDGDGVNGAFRLLNRIAIPSNSTRYFLALVVRVS